MLGCVGRPLSQRWRSSRRVLAIRLLARTSKPLTIGFTVDVLAAAVLPNLVLLAMGGMVGRIPAAVRMGLDSPAGGRLLTAFAYFGLAFAAAVLMVPFHEALANAMKVRLTYAMQGRLMKSVSGPVGITHLEDPSVLNRVALAQGNLMSFYPADAPSVLATVLGYRATWIFGCVIVSTFRWWLGLALLLVWQLTRPPIVRVISEHVRAFGGDAAVMRRAFYFQQLATRPLAAKELRIFGLGHWAVGRFQAHWVKGMAEVWRIRAGLHARAARVGVVILATYIGACAVIASAALNGEIGLSTVATLLPVLVMTMVGGSVKFEDISLEWQLSALPPLDELESELTRTPRSLAGTADPSGLPIRAVRFEGVCFRYPEAAIDLFDQLDLVLRAGTSTAIVGANGAGKTTLVKLLARLHDPTNGRILVDGIPLTELHAEAWQRRVAVVFQDFTRFPISAAENVGFGSVEHSADMDGIIEAGHRAGIGDAIDAFPAGWATVLSKQFAGGVDLSDGQWQRIALARALFAARHGASILVLDEPTSWLDARAEAAFFDGFLKITRGLTTLVISHRFSTVRRADRICVLEGGRVVEEGTHVDLLRQGGSYARLFELQAERFAGDPQRSAVGSES